jgi:DNA replication protein DnaC
MMTHPTREKLVEMRLLGMVKALDEQANTPDMTELTFEERLALLVDREHLLREERRTARSLQRAKLKLHACIEDVDYRHPRGLDKKVVIELATCRWIHAKRNLIITGATGLGKTWLACALANKACREGFSTLYARVPRLVQEMASARADGTYLKLLSRIERIDMLVLDDWALTPLDAQAQQDLLEVVDDRAGQRATLVTSQLPISKWHDMIGDPTVADALLDRIVGSATKINLKAAPSLRNKDPRPSETE